MTVLTACKTIEIAHEPVKCEGLPNVNWNLTEEEAQTVTEEVEFKTRVYVTTLKERINTQCMINKEHDKLHEGKSD